MRIAAVTLSCLSPVLALAIAGCSLSPTAGPSAETGIALRGNVHGGQQPVAYAHVYLFAANTTGYGQPSVSLLHATSTGNADSVGAYVLTNPGGDFDITGDYSCTPNTQVYLLALGGNPGAGLNSGSGIMAILGNCPSSGNFASTITYIIANEVSTIAAAYAMSGYATDALHVSSSGTPLAQIGIANAFANAANLASLSGGNALTSTPAGNGTVPTRTINTLANMLAACINTSGPESAGCTTLFGNALSAGTTGSAPTDTASAAINIAHNPAANVATLYNLPAPTAPFSPSLATPPSELTLTLNFKGGGLDEPTSVAVDGLGQIWATSVANGAVTLLSSAGAPISPNGGFSGGTASPVSVAIDHRGNAWVADALTSSVTEYSSSGALVSPVPLGYTGGGLNVPEGVAIDATGNAWVASYQNAVSEFSASGTAISSALGYTGGGLNGPGGIAIDRDGAVWIPNTSLSGISGVSKFSAAGAPLSPVNGFLGGGVKRPFAIAIDAGGNAWVANLSGSSLSKFASTGSPLSGSNGFTGGGLYLPFALAIDGAGNPWVANYGNNTVSEFSSTGTALSPDTGLAAGSLVSPQAIAIDLSGNVWVANGFADSLTEIVGAAAPVVAPLAVAIKNNMLATRP
jgi:hypothetical protein